MIQMGKPFRTTYAFAEEMIDNQVFYIYNIYIYNIYNIDVIDIDYLETKKNNHWKRF